MHGPASRAGVGALACATSTADQVPYGARCVSSAHQQTHQSELLYSLSARTDPDREPRWRTLLRPYYAELGLTPDNVPAVRRSTTVPARSSRNSSLRWLAFILDYQRGGYWNASRPQAARSSPQRRRCAKPNGQPSAAAMRSSRRAVRPGGHRGMRRSSSTRRRKASARVRRSLN